MEERNVQSSYADIHRGIVSQDSFISLSQLDGENSAATANFVSNALKPLKHRMREGGAVNVFHPIAGNVDLLNDESLNAWCAEFFPCAFLVWSHLVWNSEQKRWERFGDSGATDPVAS